MHRDSSSVYQGDENTASYQHHEAKHSDQSMFPVRRTSALHWPIETMEIARAGTCISGGVHQMPDCWQNGRSGVELTLNWVLQVRLQCGCGSVQEETYGHYRWVHRHGQRLFEVSFLAWSGIGELMVCS